MSTPLTRSLIITVLLCVLQLIGYVYLVSSLTALRAKADELARTVASHTEREIADAALRERVREVEDERKELRSFFLQFNDPAPLLEMVEEAGARFGLVVEIESVTEATLGGNKDGEAERIGRVAVKFDGAWSDCYRFVETIERLPYAVSIESVKVSRNKSEQWSGEVTFSVLGI